MDERKISVLLNVYHRNFLNGHRYSMFAVDVEAALMQCSKEEIFVVYDLIEDFRIKMFS